MQIPVLIITFALMALIAYFFIGAVIASKSERPTPYTERSRASLMVWMLFFGAVITVASLALATRNCCWRQEHNHQCDRRPMVLGNRQGGGSVR